jgi:hypothetical protein
LLSSKKPCERSGSPNMILNAESTGEGITKLCYFLALNLLLISVVLLLSTVHGAQRNGMKGGEGGTLHSNASYL